MTRRRDYIPPYEVQKKKAVMFDDPTAGLHPALRTSEKKPRSADRAAGL